jgi:cellulose synthase/poly-beta-1,6-N-acetylglucosamine synthase-like glycosyltransferase
MLFGPYLVETALWLIATVVIAVSVTRIYIDSALAIGMGKIKKLTSKADGGKREEPFVTIMIPTYNEAHVIDRVLEAVTAIVYPRYEIIVADDSTGRSMAKRLEHWRRKGKIKVVHRSTRKGYKAGALNNAMGHVDPRCEYIAFFDADYVPHKKIIWEMLSDFSQKRIAAVQGYTQHTLNASRNFVTKSASLSLSSYCLVEMAAKMKFGGFIPIFGSVFMVRRKVLEEAKGFNESSITEDWDLASKFTEMGYDILFDERISAPAECPSTFRAMLRQQIRWAEGVTRDTKNHLMTMMTSTRVSLMKKLDYLFCGFSSFNGMMGSASYVLFAIVLLVNARIIVTLPVDRSLILGLGTFGQLMLFFVAPVYIPLAVIVASLIALYRESRISDFQWCIYLFFVGLTLAPFIAYGGIRGLLLKHGSWKRTPKTGEVK